MEAFLKKFWPVLTVVLGAALPFVTPGIDAWAAAHPATAVALSWVVAHLLPSPVAQPPAAPGK